MSESDNFKAKRDVLLTGGNFFFMKNILKLKLYGYTVRGIDRRDGADYEDHIVISDLDADIFF